MKSNWGRALLFFLAASAYGQTGLATITGTVSDPSGAAVAAAPIEVRNLSTGLIVTAVSSETGNYTVPQLPIGNYDMAITVPGFKVYNHNGFTLTAQQIMREDVRLEVGTATESVTVTVETSLLKTENSQLAHNVTLSQLTTLPVLAVGSTGTTGFRDPYSMLRMIPGSNYTTNGATVINGVAGNTVQFRTDGQTTGTTAAFLAFTTHTQPSVDAVEEASVQTSNYSAEYGTAGGGVVNMVMKSGTNRYNGSIYDYATNEILNSRQPYTSLLNRSRRHDYGGTVGGPVKIPGVYDGTNKTFFFVSMEQYREKTEIRITTATVPIPAYRTGNFNQVLIGNNAQPWLRQGTGTAQVDYLDPLGRRAANGAIFDPNSTRDVVCNTTAFPGSNCQNGSIYPVRDQFVNNVIPASLFDPVAVKILALVPQPEGPNHLRGQVGGNFQKPWIEGRVSTLPSFKIDQQIGSKGRLSFYQQNNKTDAQYTFPNGETEGFPDTITRSRCSCSRVKSYRANYDHTLTPTILLHFGAGFNSFNFNDKSPTLNYDAFKELGLRGATLNRQFPIINAGAGTNTTGGMSTLGVNAQNNTIERRPAGNINVSWVKNNHTFKIGGEWRDERFPIRGFTNVAGNYAFGNSTVQTALQNLPSAITVGSTGFTFASFMLGDLSSATLAQQIASGTRKSQWALFIQDAWKLTPKLTVDYGLRWDYGTYAKEDYGRNANFSSLAANPSAGGHPGGQIFEATCNCNFAANYPYAIGPRLGAAYQINTKTVLRAGFGVVYTATGTAGGSSVNSADTGLAAFGQTFGKLRDGMPANVRPIWPNLNANAGQPNGTLVTAPTFLDPNAGRPAKQYQWSIGLQREINRNLAVEASYVANRGVWWAAGALSPLNALSRSQMAARGFTDYTSTAEANLLLAQVGLLTTAQRSTLAARGVVLPYGNFPANQTVRQSMLPFPQYTGNINPSQAPLGKTWYDSVQITVTQRFHRGLSLTGNFTYSKALDLNNSVDPFNRELGKNLAGTDLPLQFRLTGEYQIPTLPGVSGNRVLSYIVSGWGLGWYMQYQSAPVLGRPADQGANPISRFLGFGPGGAQLKLNADGSEMNPWSVNWVDYDGKQRTDPIDINCHCFDPTKNVALNPAAWESVPAGQFGRSQSTIRSFRGMRYPSENFNVSRNFRLAERMVLHLRVEVTNAFNRTQLPNPSLLTFTAAPQTFAPGTANAGLYSAGFGTMNPLGGTANSRTGLFVGRLTF